MPNQTNKTDDSTRYRYPDSSSCHAHAYLMPLVLELLSMSNLNSDKRVFDLGCGNGSAAADLANAGYDVTGVDPAEEGIRIANDLHPNLKLFVGSGYDSLCATYGRYPLVMSLEVVEHVYDPRKFAANLFDLLEPGGTAIISTPYHGYLKNLALAATGALDKHFTALWDHGHIKFWSIATLTELLQETGFEEPHFRFAGRIYPFSKSMFAIAKKPQSTA